MITLATLVQNARRTGHESQHVALAGALMGLPDVRSLCVWCASELEFPEVYRLPKGGECGACSYTGYDCLVVSP